MWRTKRRPEGEGKSEGSSGTEWETRTDEENNSGKKVLDVKEFFPQVPRGRFLENLKYSMVVLKGEMPCARRFCVERQERLSIDLSIPRGGLLQRGWRKLGPTPTCRQMFTEEKRNGWRCINLADTEEILTVAWRYGVVRMSRVHHVPWEGFTIGGNEQGGRWKVRSTGTGRRR